MCVEWRRGVISMGVGVKGRIKRSLIITSVPINVL